MMYVKPHLPLQNEVTVHDDRAKFTVRIPVCDWLLLETGHVK